MSLPSPSKLQIRWSAPVKATWLLIGVLVVVHVATGLWYEDDLIRALIYDRPRRFRVAVGGQHQVLIERGEQWRWLTSVFLHTGFWHLAFNASSLWVVGKVLEPWIGGLRWWAVFVLGGGRGLPGLFLGRRRPVRWGLWWGIRPSRMCLGPRLACVGPSRRAR